MDTLGSANFRHHHPLQPGHWLQCLRRYWRHECRCWRRVSYWLRRFNSRNATNLRCYAFRPCPPDSLHHSRDG